MGLEWIRDGRVNGNKGTRRGGERRTEIEEGCHV